ncbi:MAG: TAXI family TRAP transporter solute-binding subunit [Egibacteraceae bacterium]
MTRVVAVVVSAVLVAVAMAGCVGSSGQETLAGPLRIATGNPGAVYYPYGQGLAEVINRELPGVEAAVISTSGARENLEMLAGGRAEVAFTLADTAADVAAQGTRMAALARLYDSEMQLVVLADGPIEEVADLRGKRVSIGRPGSGSALTATRLLDVAGVIGDVQTVPVNLTDGVEALERREIDALVFSGGVPGPAIADLATRVPIRLLDLDEFVPRMRERYGDFYYETSIPASVYGLERQVGTIAVPNYLVVSESMPSEMAYQLTKLLFAHQDELAANHQEGDWLNPRSAIATYPVPLHPGSERYYRQAHR